MDKDVHLQRHQVREVLLGQDHPAVRQGDLVSSQLCKLELNGDHFQRKIEPVHIPDPSNDEDSHQIYNLERTYSKEELYKLGGNQ